MSHYIVWQILRVAANTSGDWWGLQWQAEESTAARLLHYAELTTRNNSIYNGDREIKVEQVETGNLLFWRVVFGRRMEDYYARDEQNSIFRIFTTKNPIKSKKSL